MRGLLQGKVKCRIWILATPVHSCQSVPPAKPKVVMLEGGLKIQTVTPKATHYTVKHALLYFCVLPGGRILRICLQQILILNVEEIVMTEPPGLLLETAPARQPPELFPWEAPLSRTIRFRDSSLLMLPGCRFSVHGLLCV